MPKSRNSLTLNAFGCHTYASREFSPFTPDSATECTEVVCRSFVSMSRITLPLSPSLNMTLVGFLPSEESEKSNFPLTNSAFASPLPIPLMMLSK